MLYLGWLLVHILVNGEAHGDIVKAGVNLAGIDVIQWPIPGTAGIKPLPIDVVLFVDVLCFGITSITFYSFLLWISCFCKTGRRIWHNTNIWSIFFHIAGMGTSYALLIPTERINIEKKPTTTSGTTLINVRSTHVFTSTRLISRHVSTHLAWLLIMILLMTCFLVNTLFKTGG